MCVHICFLFLWCTGFESFGVSRKFATGKQAKKAAATVAAERELYEEAMKHSEEAVKTKEILGMCVGRSVLSSSDLVNRPTPALH
jgi:hypothetical protein